jgi:GT2 family glycosyltransferase
LRQELWSYLALLDRGSDVIVAGPNDGDFLYGANLAVRRSAINEVGLFRVDLGPNGSTPSRCEDSEMLKRLLSAGKRVVYTPHAIVHHCVQPERLRMSYIRRWKFHAGRSAARMAPPTSGRLSRWLIRECLTNGVGSLWAYARRARTLGVQREMVFWSQLGRVIGALDQSWRRHPRSA